MSEALQQDRDLHRAPRKSGISVMDIDHSVQPEMQANSERGECVIDFWPMKNLPILLALIALVLAVWALVDAHTALSRLEEFGLRPH